MEVTAPYSRRELRAARARLPRRGLLCHVCGLRVPRFAELDGRARRRIIRLINEERPIMAAVELRQTTGCPDRWALLWVLHKGRPRGRRPGPPCRRCGRLLRDSRAERCVHCEVPHLYDAAAHPDLLRIAADPAARCHPAGAIEFWLSPPSLPLPASLPARP